ncbi:MAG: DUF4214 domain-containing protein [Pseudomonadota bacterium]
MFYLVDATGDLYYGTEATDTLLFVTQTRQALTDVAAAPDGRLYAIGADTLFEFDLTDFTIAPLTGLSIDDATGLEVGADGTLFVIAEDGAIGSVDPEEGIVTVIAETGVNMSAGDHTIIDDEILVVNGTGQVFSVSTATGEIVDGNIFETFVPGLSGIAVLPTTVLTFSDELAYALDPETASNPVSLIGPLISPEDEPIGDVTGAAGIPGAGLGLSVEESRDVALLYEAALDRDGNIDLDGLNFWIDQREAGLTERQLSQAFLNSPEFEASFGDPDMLSDMELVEVLYRNVLDRAGEPLGIAFWTGALEDETIDRADVLLAFADSVENREGSPQVQSLVEISAGDYIFLA